MVKVKGEEERRKLRIKAARFVLMYSLLYKRSFSILYLRCLTLPKVKYAIRGVHERINSNHLKAQALVHKLAQSRYFWPTMKMNVEEMVKKCDKC